MTTFTYNDITIEIRENVFNFTSNRENLYIYVCDFKHEELLRHVYQVHITYDKCDVYIDGDAIVVMDIHYNKREHSLIKVNSSTIYHNLKNNELAVHCRGDIKLISDGVVYDASWKTVRTKNQKLITPLPLFNGFQKKAVVDYKSIGLSAFVIAGLIMFIKKI